MDGQMEGWITERDIGLGIRASSFYHSISGFVYDTIRPQCPLRSPLALTVFDVIETRDVFKTI